MEKKIVYTFKEIKKDILKNSDKLYHIIYIGNSGKYGKVVPTYCLLYSGDKFYYIQEEYFGGLKITLYNKKDANTKRQADYPKTIYSYNDIIDYIEKTKSKSFKDLKDTFDQVIFYDMLTIESGETLKNYLNKIGGYREKEILRNLDYIKEFEKTDNYHLLYFYDKEGNHFVINTKSRERLIVG